MHACMHSFIASITAAVGISLCHDTTGLSLQIAMPRCDNHCHDYHDFCLFFFAPFGATTPVEVDVHWPRLKLHLPLAEWEQLLDFKGFSCCEECGMLLSFNSLTFISKKTDL